MTTATPKMIGYRLAAWLPCVVTTSCGKPSAPMRLGKASSPVALLLACSPQAASTSPMMGTSAILARRPARSPKTGRGKDSPPSRVDSLWNAHIIAI